ncbi:MAG: hypothetical protein ACK5CT_03705 [Bacteroidota bacterium]|jgi:hypothetical protein
MLRTIANRFYADYLLPDRLHVLGTLIESALQVGYVHKTISNHFLQLSTEPKAMSELVFIHRTDVDTDCGTARKMFEVFKSFGITSTFYFRRSTLDVRLMRELHDSGFEVGYHYEEIADFCKELRTLDPMRVSNAIPDLKLRFLKNLKSMESAAGFKFTSVASHGDFVNRKLGIPNHTLIDADLISDAGLILEAYNPVLLDSLTDYTSDSAFPTFYREGRSPFDAVKRGSDGILFLSHPRHWHAAPWLNFKDTLIRLKEGLLIR